METILAPPQIGFVTAEISVHTERAHEFIDITDEVTTCLANSHINNGLAVISSQHTTAAVIINEHEPELHKDLDRFLENLAPAAHDYAHNEAPCGPGEQPNGHSHCQALLLTTSVTLSFVAGALCLGRYQRLFLVELDCARPRRVTVAFLGS